MRVESKKRRIPSVIGWHPESHTKVEFFHSEDGLCVGAAPGEDEQRWVSSARAARIGDRGSFYVPAPDVPELDICTSRFVGKVALEVLAHKIVEVPGANDEIVDKSELDELRRFVRTGFPRSVWPVNMRRLYPQDQSFKSSEYEPHQLLHEFTILTTTSNEYYGVIAIFGIEYVINLGGPELTGFQSWLDENNQRSPLYD
jgi:hypothetical protein